MDASQFCSRGRRRAGVLLLALLVGAALSGGAGGREPEEPASSGLARRPNPVFPEKAECGTWLKPLPTHRKMGSVYHTIAASRFDVGGVAARASLAPPVGYAVARLPMSSGADGTIGSVLLAGQWLVPWTALLDEATLQSWSSAGGLKIDQFPDVGFTIRASVDTRELSKNESSSSYSCTVIADVTINGVTTEVLVPRAVLTLSRAGVEGSGRRVKGDVLSLRARWKLRLADFLTTGASGVPPMVDVSVDLLGATVPPEFQAEGSEPTPEPAEPASPAGERKDAK